MTHTLAPSPARTVEEAILTRRSVRAFLPTPVPRADVERVLTLASRSASNSNVQPWQVHVLSGQAKQRLTAALLHAFDTAGRTPPEYRYQPDPDQWPEPFRSRRTRFGDGLYAQTLGLDKADTARRLGHHKRNYDFFGAPVGMILTVSRHPLLGALVDAGLFLQGLMLAARSTGMDTCAQASFIDFSPVIRNQLQVPQDQLIVCGIALGYADPDHPLNSYQTPREPAVSFSTFYGDEPVALHDLGSAE